MEDGWLLLFTAFMSCRVNTAFLLIQRYDASISISSNHARDLRGRQSLVESSPGKHVQVKVCSAKSRQAKISF
jgi:hypothetical protein